ncbi:hypothetical protein A45J_2083 [hot springs metagenome]|uniref:Uncharacterized protein n=1 Tax=hot springs metagenome TaxID=433727 RepID=A0A5J4L4Z3_9ZZZZ
MDKNIVGFHKIKKNPSPFWERGNRLKVEDQAEGLRLKF